MTEKKEIKISAAKGRPMLSWVGKRPLRHVTAFPAQHVETFALQEETAEVSKNSEVWKEWPAAYPKGGLLFHGDNKEVLAHLLANGFRGRVKLIYIDPPFDSGADYVRKVQLRGGAATAKIDGESYTLGEQIQYTDIWANDNYLQFMYERLMLLKELLAEDGSIYLHCDPSKNSYLRILMDEVFGSENFVNEIIWQRLSAHNDSTRYGIIHDTLYYYSKAGKRIWNPQATKLSERYIEQFFDSVEESTGRRYSRSDLTARGLRNGETGKPWKRINPAAKGNHWKVPIAQLEEWDCQGRIHWPKTGGMPRLKRYLDEVEKQGGSPQDVWYDIRPIHNQSQEILDYPTQKPGDLIERILKTSSNTGDLILDCFIGSGTTAAVAQKLDRRWIGCDINKGAIQTTAKRLQTIITDQIETEKNRHPELFDVGANGVHPLADENTGAEAGACLASPQFTVWRVNDYDLQIQHNEAKQLVSEHIGLERIASDSYFDGKLGKKLVKIVPFEHPLSPIDLEELKKELEARPEVENTLVMVCLGIELAARTWIDDWNRLRERKKDEHQQKIEVNKIEVIELRTDAKYGNFIKHEPAVANVAIKRDGDKVKVDIDDFISPTILKRLDMDLPLFKAKISDWRSQVDCLMIDTAYNGDVFNVALTDVPEKKNDLIEGHYSLPAPAGKTTIAVKIIDMLGEEVLKTEEV